MNRTTIFVTFAALAGLGIIGAVVVAVVAAPLLGNVTSLIVTILGLVSVAAGTFHALGRVNEKVEVIQKQTNGTITRLMDEKNTDTRSIRSLENEVAQLRAALNHPARKVTR